MPLLAANKVLIMYSNAEFDGASDGGAYFGWVPSFEGHMSYQSFKKLPKVAILANHHQTILSIDCVNLLWKHIGKNDPGTIMALDPLGGA